MDNESITSATQLNNAIIKLINEADIPFDAKVFVLRSIHTDIENTYRNAIKQMLANNKDE